MRYTKKDFVREDGSTDFEDYYNHKKVKEYRQEEKYNFLAEHECEYVSIGGSKGAGKGSLVTALLNIYFKFYKDKRQVVDNELDDLYIKQNKDIKRRKTYIFYNPKAVLNVPNKRNNEYIQTEPVNPAYIRMPRAKTDDDYKPFQVFPYGSIIAVSDDTDTEDNNIGENASKIDSTQYEYLKKQRHNGITLLMESQKPKRSKAYKRDLYDCILWLAEQNRYMLFNRKKDKKDRRDDWWHRIRRVEWKCYMYYGDDEVVELGINGTLPLNRRQKKAIKKRADYDPREKIKTIKIVYHGDIFERYDSESFKSQFTEHLEDAEDSVEYTGNVVKLIAEKKKESKQRTVKNDKGEQTKGQAKIS